MGSYEHSRVSLPDSVVDAPSLATTLPAQARLYLEELATRMLLPHQEAALIRELDGLPAAEELREVRAARARHRPGQPDPPTFECDWHIFVKKEDGARLRLIVDCRRIN
eukprot:1814098-Pyramimonas_sp.AAC.1